MWAHHLSEVIAIYPITRRRPWVNGAVDHGPPNIARISGARCLWSPSCKVKRALREQCMAHAANRLAHDDLHREPGLAVDDPEYVQERGRAHLGRIPCHRPGISGAGALHLWRSVGRHGDARRDLRCSARIVQQVMDLRSSRMPPRSRHAVPFLHFFDGFRTSHEVMKVEQLTTDDIRAMIDDDLVRAHRARGLSPDHPVMRGAAQNPDVYFLGRETVNSFMLRPWALFRRRWISSPSSSGGSTSVRLCRRTDADRRNRRHGLGAEVAQETAEY